MKGEFSSINQTVVAFSFFLPTGYCAIFVILQIYWIISFFASSYNCEVMGLENMGNSDNNK